mmetsp:Transcript_3453/g.8731  ORF Transcript_3453/g.8731 Transcript_3453/m.8731 type:complete len:375 (-) Transcript_3453:387-1511(-)
MNLYVRVALLEGGRVERRWQQGTHRLLRADRERLRELDREDEEEVAEHERVPERGHALALDSLHHAERLVGVRVRHDVHGVALARLLRGQRLFPGGLLEVRTLAIHHEDADVDSLPLELRVDRLLQSLDVGCVALGHVVEARAVAILKDLPLRLGLPFGQRIEAGVHGLHDLAWGGLDEQLPAVKVRDVELEAAERLHKRNLLLHEQVGALPLEDGVLLLLTDEDDVTGIRIGMLVGHLSKGNLVTVHRAFRDHHLQHLPLLAGAEGAALAPAGAAGRLHLLDHGPHAHDLHLHAATVAGAALGDPLLLVDHLSRDGHLLGGSHVELLQGDLQRLHHVLRLLAPPSAAPATAAAAATEERLEDVRRVAPAATIL